MTLHLTDNVTGSFGSHYTKILVVSYCPHEGLIDQINKSTIWPGSCAIDFQISLARFWIIKQKGHMYFLFERLFSIDVQHEMVNN